MMNLEKLNKLDMLVESWGRVFVSEYISREKARELLSDLSDNGVTYEEFIGRLTERYKEL